MDDNEQKKIISENLNYYLGKIGIEQKDLCVALDIHPSTLNTWVKGRALPPVSQLQRIASYLHLFVSDIIEPRTETPEEKILLKYYHSMNAEGRSELLKYAGLLFRSGDYGLIDWRKENHPEDDDYIPWD